ncbi:MAG: glycosyltransferase [FCB group bacterium]|jgi:succinoglycan biosynthesis protein ExoM|nr:glycosyltransferase [FCB group bacterium]
MTTSERVPSISVVIITYNGRDMLVDALRCMMRQETRGRFTYEIVVVDDRSTDGTGEAVDALSIESPVPLRYVLADGRGVPAARNRGFAECRSDYIAFFDQDQLAEPDWLEALFDVAERFNADVVDGPRDLLLPKEELDRLNGVCRAHLGEIPGGGEPRPITTRTGSCTGNQLIRRGVVEFVGDFDERILRGGEEWDYFRRVRRAGFTFWFAPKAVVHHVIPPERLSERFFAWRSVRNGQSFAYRDLRDWGLAKTTLSCLARIAKSTLYQAPLWAIATLRGNRMDALGHRCMMLRTAGYAGRTLSFHAPRLFPEDRLFARFELRREKEATAPDDPKVTGAGVP